MRRGCGAGARRGAAVAAAGVALLTASTSYGDRPPVPRFALEWDAPAGCLDRAAAQRAIEGALGAKPSTGGPVTVVRVKIAETEAGRFAADIWMYDATGSGERTLEGSVCVQVAQAAALIVAFALETGREAGATGKKEAHPSEASQGAGSEAPAGRSLSLAVGAWVTGDVGSLPQADAGLALVLEGRHRRLSAEAIGSAWLPQTALTATAATSGGDFALYTGALRGCVDLLPAERPGVKLGPCAGAEVGMTSGSGVGLSTGKTRRVFWGAGLFGLSLRYLGFLPLAFGMVAELGVPMHRAAWQIDDVGTVFQPTVVIGRASLGVSWQFL